MPRFIDDTNFVNTKIRENLEQSLNSFSEKLGSAPTFVEYYNRNLSASTADSHIDNVYQVVGSKSPTKYNKIENFPIYKLDTMSLDRSFGDYGAESDISISAEILPGTITPYSDDIILLKYNYAGETPKQVMLRVDNVTDSIMDNRKYYKISMHLYDKPIDWLQEQIKEDLRFDISDYENNRTPILPKALFTVLRDCRKIRASFVQKYLDYFFDENVNALAMNAPNSTSSKYINTMAQLLAEKFGIFVFDRKFLKTALAFNYSTPQREYYHLDETYENCIYALFSGELEINSLTNIFLAQAIAKSPLLNSIYDAFMTDYSDLLPWPVVEREDIYPFSPLPGFVEHMQQGILYKIKEPEKEEEYDPDWCDKQDDSGDGGDDITPPNDPVNPDEPEPDVNIRVLLAGHKHRYPRYNLCFCGCNCGCDDKDDEKEEIDIWGDLPEGTSIWLENTLITMWREKKIPESMYRIILDEATAYKFKYDITSFLKVPAILAILKQIEEQIVPVVSKPITYERIY